MRSSVRYPRLAAAAFLLAVTIVTLAATLGILWLFVPDVAVRTVEQGGRFVRALVEFAQSTVAFFAPTP